MAFVIDKESSGADQKLEIPGWKLKGWKGGILEHAYGSNFGEGEQPSNYSVANFEMVIERPISFFSVEADATAGDCGDGGAGQPADQPQALDARLALPMGALLSAIFLQKGYSDTFPDLGYLVFMDKIYLLAYPLILIVLIRSIVALTTTQDARDSEVNAMRRIDRRYAAALAIAFAVGTALLTALR